MGGIPSEEDAKKVIRDRLSWFSKPGGMGDGARGSIWRTERSHRTAPALRMRLSWVCLLPTGINIRLHFGIGNWMGCYHWIPASPLFSGLPGRAGRRGLRERAPALRDVRIGRRGSGRIFSNSQTRLEAPAMLWYSDIERITLGKGRLVFCQYLIFDPPVADPYGRPSSWRI